MGSSESKPSPPPSPPPPPKPLFQTCWREDAAWSNRQYMVNQLRKFPLDDPELGIRVLLHGPVGAGKSSFVNSVKTVFANHVVVNVLAENISDFSFTRKYQTHHIKDGAQRLPFMFNDIMGLESQEGAGVHIDDITSALEGHVPEGYEFNPCARLTHLKPEYVKNPKLSAKVHCLVSVVNADKMQMMSEAIIGKMRAIRQKASDLGIPQIVVMTMVDTACPEVKRDLKNIYKSKEIRTKMQKCSNELGVPMNCILPVKNYHEETYTNKVTDVLILEVMTKIVEVANDYIWQKQQQIAD